MDKHTIVYLSRKPSSGQISIERVFRAIIQQIQQEYSATFVQVPRARANLFSLLSNLFFSFFVKADIIHVTGDINYCIIPLHSCKRILTIHDLGGYYHHKARGGIHFFFMKLLWWHLPLKLSTKVTCISDFTYKELLKNFPWCRDKIVVIPDPLPNGFFYSPDYIFTPNKPILLQIGTKDNKNLIRLIESIKGFTCHLRIIGPLSENQYKTLKESNIEYSNTSNLSNEEIILEYKRCTVLCIISTYEGFGMPIIEAQAIGRPVLTSNLSPMKEVANGAALLVDPYDIHSIRAGIEKICSDSSFCKELIDLGLINASKYHAKNITEEYSSVYSDVLKSSQ